MAAKIMRILAPMLSTEQKVQEETQEQPPASTGGSKSRDRRMLVVLEVMLSFTPSSLGAKPPVTLH